MFLVCVKKKKVFSFTERLLYTSNAYGRHGYYIKRSEFSFSSLVMHQIAPTQQPKQQPTLDEAFQIFLQERSQQGSLRQPTHMHRLACF